MSIRLDTIPAMDKQTDRIGKTISRSACSACLRTIKIDGKYLVIIKQLKLDVKHLTQLFKLELVLLKCLLCFCTALFRLNINTEGIILDS